MTKPPRYAERDHNHRGKHRLDDDELARVSRVALGFLGLGVTVGLFATLAHSVGLSELQLIQQLEDFWKRITPDE